MSDRRTYYREYNRAHREERAKSQAEGHKSRAETGAWFYEKWLEDHPCRLCHELRPTHRMFHLGPNGPNKLKEVKIRHDGGWALPRLAKYLNGTELVCGECRYKLIAEGVLTPRPNSLYDRERCA